MMSRIVGYGSYLPAHILTNNKLATCIDTSDEWITKRTGIKHRHIVADGEYTSDLATAALKQAMLYANKEASDLDAIIVATTTPDLVFPATAVRAQSNIGMEKGFAFDIQAVCAGFLYALSVADSLIKSQQAKCIAVIGAESMSKIVDWQDRTTCILFGDGAGCVILEGSKAPNIGVQAIELFSDSNSIDILKVDGGVSKGNLSAKVSMVGKEVFKYAVSKMHESVSSLLQKLDLDASKLDWVLPHQANARILEAVAEKLGVREDKVVSTIAYHGNTSAASIPIALDSYIRAGKMKEGQLIAMTAVGAGMTWGSAIVRL